MIFITVYQCRNCGERFEGNVEADSEYDLKVNPLSEDKLEMLAIHRDCARRNYLGLGIGDLFCVRSLQ